MKTRLTPADRLLIRTCVRAPWYGLLLVLGLCAVTASSLLIPAALAAAANEVLAHRAAGPATLRLATLLAAYSLSSLAVGLISPAIIAGNTTWLSRRLFTHAISLGVPGQETFPPGDMTSRLLNGVPAASGAGIQAFQVATGLLTSLGAIGALWLTDWRIGCTFVVSAVLLAVVVRPSMRGASDAFLRYQRAQGRLATLLSEAIGGIRTIASSGTADRETERILRPLPELAAAGAETWSVQRRVAWRFALCLGLIEVPVLATAGLLVAAGRLSPGDWLAVAGYATLALGAVESIDAVMEIAHARAAATRVCEVLVTSPAGRAAGRAAGTARLTDVSGQVTFRGVTVAAGGHRILDGVNLHVPAGSTAAIVGRSGAGKTTLVGLLGMVSEPDEGEILLDGVAVSSVRPADLHRALAYAFARPASLGKTIADHIGYGTPHLSRAETEHAARIARAHDFIERLPLGYDTPLAGAPLSGGERQRLGIARAVAADARVLVLDDATSSLDTATEAQVTEALRELRAGRTTLVIAHRASTAALADTVIWLDGGRIRAMAPHARLWSDPDYRAVFAAQSPHAAGPPRTTSPPRTPNPHTENPEHTADLEPPDLAAPNLEGARR